MYVLKRLSMISMLIGTIYGCGVEVVELNESTSSKRGEADQGVNSGDLQDGKGLYISIPLPDAVVEESVEVDPDLEKEIAQAPDMAEEQSRIAINVKCRADRERPTGAASLPSDDIDTSSNEKALGLSSIPLSLFKTTLTTYNRNGEIQKESVARAVYCSGAVVRLHIRDLKSNSKYQLSATYNDTYKMYEGTTKIFSLASANQTVLVMERKNDVNTGDAAIRVIFSDRQDSEPGYPGPIPRPIPAPQPSPEPPTACTDNFQWLYHPTSYEAVAASDGCRIKALKEQGYLTGQELMVELRKELEDGAICTQEAGQLGHPVSKEVAHYMNGCQKSILMKAGFTNQIAASMPGSVGSTEPVAEPVSTTSVN